MTITLQRGRRRRRTAAVLVVLALVAFVIVTERVFVHPSLAPVPAHADAIVELGGEAMEGRDQLALQLAREHRAAYLVQSTNTGEAGTDRCLPPVPRVTVLCFHAEPNTTRGEAQWIQAEARRLGWRSVILVTTPDQAWRARLRTDRCFDGDVYVATSHLPAWDWLRQIPYQWGASVKAIAFQRSC